MKELIGIIAASLVIVAYIPYFRDILNGRTKPHPYSWFVWGLNTAIISALQVTHGAGFGSLTTFTAATVSFAICALSLKRGVSDIRLIDTVFLILALIGMVIWLFAKEPVASMILLVTIDILGLLPSMRKAWNKPYEETLFMWSLNGFRHSLSILAIRDYSIITLLNPLVWAIGNLSFSLLLVLRRRKIPRVNK